MPTPKEIADAYAEHGQMFVRDGKKIPLKEVKEQIRAFLEEGVVEHTCDGVCDPE